jgi:hypothetical protein
MIKFMVIYLRVYSLTAYHCGTVYVVLVSLHLATAVSGICISPSIGESTSPLRKLYVSWCSVIHSEPVCHDIIHRT